jgi:hypothetical protein
MMLGRVWDLLNNLKLVSLITIACGGESGSSLFNPLTVYNGKTTADTISSNTVVELRDVTTDVSMIRGHTFYGQSLTRTCSYEIDRSID